MREIPAVLRICIRRGRGEYFYSASFAQPTMFALPRRVMLSARLNVGR